MNRFKKKKILLLIILISIASCFLVKIFKNDTDKKIDLNDIVPIRKLTSSKNIKGQTKVSNSDGYTTKFTTLNSNHKKTYTEYKQNQYASWENKSYWGGTMAENGCGITSLAIICSGYKLNLTPEYFRKEYYPHLDSTKIQDTLINLGVECSEFYFDSNHINKQKISEHLQTHRPILIALNNKKQNKWTKASHYMVLLDIDSDGNFYLSNPNGIDGTKTSSNWYNPNEIIPYVAKIMFIESY